MFEFMVEFGFALELGLGLLLPLDVLLDWDSTKFGLRFESFVDDVVSVTVLATTSIWEGEGIVDAPIAVGDWLLARVMFGGLLVVAICCAKSAKNPGVEKSNCDPSPDTDANGKDDETD